MGNMERKKRGAAGNAVLYITRNQALKRLQLKLSEFRRLCILKGIHPREPKKKVQGQHKTYYHIKDINYLAHEPLVNKFRDAYAYDHKIRKARAKKNRDLARRLQERRPTYRLDHLVKERYPSFMGALRDLDDPLTLVHLFATLPAEKAAGIPPPAVATARRLALEWQAWVVRAAALRKAFISVKGFYFQAHVLGQPVTWLVPHATAQVLPADVDYRVMLTFLEFYSTLVQFVNFKLYHMLGAAYPPLVDPTLEQAAAGLAAVMHDLAATGTTSNAEPAKTSGAGPPQPLAARQPVHPLQPSAQRPADSAASGGHALAAQTPSTLDSDGDELEAGSISSGANEEDASDSGEAAAPAATTEDRPAGPASISATDTDAAMPGVGLESTGPGAAAVIDPNDEEAVCGSLFHGLTFFLGREVPREQLLFVIRAFGGAAGWEGEGSPLQANDEAITHQVVDRPSQSHRFLGRVYVQPQWVVDSANFRAAADARLYAPGVALPPHVSPFATEEDEGYVPDYAKALQALQDAARAARLRAAGEAAPAAVFVGEAAVPAGTTDLTAAAPGTAAAAAEEEYRRELLLELGEQPEPEVAVAEVVSTGTGGGPAASGTKRRAAEAVEGLDAENEEALAAVMLPRKGRVLYASVKREERAKRARVEQLTRKKAALAAADGR